MKCFLALAVVAAVWWPAPVSADAIISGRGCAIDGNTIQIGSKLKDKKCWGGINVRLHGSIARELDAQCPTSDGNSWPCGRAARFSLDQLLKRRSITCYHIDGAFKDNVPIVTCLSGRKDLALEMVLQGVAEAAHDESKRYELEEADAKKAKRGLWK